MCLLCYLALVYCMERIGNILLCVCISKKEIEVTKKIKRINSSYFRSNIIYLRRHQLKATFPFIYYLTGHSSDMDSLKNASNTLSESLLRVFSCRSPAIISIFPDTSHLENSSGSSKPPIALATSLNKKWFTSRLRSLP